MDEENVKKDATSKVANKSTSKTNSKTGAKTTTSKTTTKPKTTTSKTTTKPKTTPRKTATTKTKTTKKTVASKNAEAGTKSVGTTTKSKTSTKKAQAKKETKVVSKETKSTKTSAKKTTSKTKEVNEAEVEKNGPVANKDDIDKTLIINTDDIKKEAAKKDMSSDKTFKMASKQPAQTASKKKTKHKERAGHKFLKFILVVFAIVAFAYLAIVVHNATLMREIMDVTMNTKDLTNYHCTITHYEGKEKVSTVDVYKKDGISKITLRNELDSKQEIVMWKNKSTNEGLTIFPNQKKVARCNADEVLDFTVMSYYSEDQAYINSVCLSSYISTSKLQDRDCYVIKRPSQTMWIDKETGAILKNQNGQVVKSDGEELSSTAEFTNWRFNDIKDSEVAKPDLVGYTITK